MITENTFTIPYFIFGNIDVYLLFVQQAHSLQFEAFESFPKQTYRNRIATLGSQGVMQSTIPIQHTHTKLVSEITIAYDVPWHLQFWQMLVSNYTKSAYFEYYAPELESLLMSKPTSYMTFAKQSMAWVSEQIGITLPTQETSNFHKNLGENDLRHLFKCSKNSQLFKQQSYHQVFSDRFPFQPNLSILDLLFNCGPESYAYLQSCLPLKRL